MAAAYAEIKNESGGFQKDNAMVCFLDRRRQALVSSLESLGFSWFVSIMLQEGSIVDKWKNSCSMEAEDAGNTD